jgi:hypothetical protein
VPDADGARTEIEEVRAWAAGLEAVHARIAGRFARAEPRRRVLAYLRGLVGNVGDWPTMTADLPFDPSRYPASPITEQL